ncbi:prepilin-type N-terminal cleavage/methylation domain-containing protein [Candidatus Saccharibacteria bacterium]|nr:prepilin-type N-terminal cleavage/methylation domain-containing protein [Candidatus Saccharibacteria bacterium]
MPISISNKGHLLIMKFPFRTQGFTIVELLIVVVIIAILAAITIIAYTGLQARANNSAADTLVNNVAKKMHAYYTLAGAYPSNTAAGELVNSLNTYSESRVGTATFTAIPSTATPNTPSAANGKTSLKVELCTAPVTNTPGAGVRLTKYDYTTKAPASTPLSLGVTSGTCTQTS